jgi:tetratricopeptide (TPR) repeat protein
MAVRTLGAALLGAVLLTGAPTIAVADQKDPRLDALFSELVVTDSAERGLRFMALGQGFDAMRAFDAVVEAAPEFAEGWNKRATVRYALGDIDGSIVDIRRTLALEPRHFGALSGLGLCRLAQDRPAEALEAFEAALKINPHLDGLANIKALRDQVRGKPL